MRRRAVSQGERSSKYSRVFRLWSWIVCLLLTYESSAAQLPRLWRSTFKNLGPVIALRRAPDGGSIAAGNGTQGEFLIKIGSDGAIEWHHTIYTSPLVQLSSMEIDSSGDIICCGTHSPSGASTQTQAAIQCFDKNGYLKKNLIFKSITKVLDAHLLRLSDGTYVISGTATDTPPVPYIIHLSPVFSILASYEVFPSDVTSQLLNAFVTQGKDNSLMLLGNYASFTTAIVIANDVVDTQQFYRSLGSVIGSKGICHTNGDIYIATAIHSPSSVATLLRFHPNGDLKFALQADRTVFSIPSSIEEDSDGTILFASQSVLDSFMRCVRFDTNGKVLQIADMKIPKKALSTSFLASGATHTTRMLLSTPVHAAGDDYESELYWGTVDSAFTSCLSKPILAPVTPLAISASDCTWFYTAGITVSIDSLQFIMSEEELPLPDPLCSEAVPLSETGAEQLLTVTPNPANRSGGITIHAPLDEHKEYRLILRSMMGANIAEQQLPAGSGHDIRLSISGLASGLYFVELADANSFATLWRGKVVVE